MARLSQVFAPRDREFFDLFEEASANILRGADLLDRMLRNYPETKELAREILLCEQEGDRITHDIVNRLNQSLGGWRIIKTMGSRIIKMDPAQGFAAQGSGAAVILAATHFGYPLSTTHTISGAVMGAGAAKRLSAVRWGVAGNIVVAWVLTLPCAALVGGLVYGVTHVFGDGAAGPVIVAAAGVVFTAYVFLRRLQHGVSLAFSIVIRGAVRAGEHRRTRPLVAGAHALMAVVGLLVVLAAILFGVSTMLAK